MSKNKSLPDSLELLLDTMCNTFGGIMFIAISLIVISSMIGKTVASLLPKDIDSAAIKKFEAESAELRKKIEALQQQENDLLQKQFQNIPADRQKKIQDIIEMKQKNAALKRQWEKQELERILLERKNAETEKTVTQKKAENQTADNKTKIKKEKTRRTLEENIKILNKLQNEYDLYVPKHLSFSIEEATSKQPYFIGIKNGKLFRIGTNQAFCLDEITVEEQKILRTIRFILRPGKGVYAGRGNEGVFNAFFRNISSDSYFIWVAVGEDSFSEFYQIKQYLRKKNYDVYWHYNPEFVFSRVNNADYRSSQ